MNQGPHTMKHLLLLSLLLGYLADAVFSANLEHVRWCVTSDKEYKKCSDLAAQAPVFSCVLKLNSIECIDAIKKGTADAITLDGGDVYTAGLEKYQLQPIIAEHHGNSSEGCYYAVAVVKKGSGFGIRDLAGKRSCHTGLGKSAGWNMPIGALLKLGILKWGGHKSQTIEDAVGSFFSSSCAPGADKGSQLCKNCKGDCSKSQNEPFYDYDGAFQCLVEDAGDVAFVNHLTVPDDKEANYELLCPDNTRARIEDYKECHLARVPAHAVVTRKQPKLAELIWKSLSEVQGFDLFSSKAYAPAKNLMFSDSTEMLVQLPSNTTSFLYLGAGYTSIMRSLNKEVAAAGSSALMWCAVGPSEMKKCQSWSIKSMVDGDTKILCQTAPTVEECIRKIMSNEADAMSVDGGEVFIAGQCGLVPAMVEQYNEAKCNTSGASASSYYAVAVVKRNSGITWDSLRGRRSCHTGYGRNAGWNVPMGQIYKETGDCDFTMFFSSGCAPGAPASSPFCSQCAGSGNKTVGNKAKCQPNSEEEYYGYVGAFRCLVEGAGDVAFTKHSVVQENSNGKGPAWASNILSSDYELICPQLSGSAPIGDFKHCHLGAIPAHAVITRPETRDHVVSVLGEQQVKFGRGGNNPSFEMFHSQSDKNLLFKDSTKCLQEVPSGLDYKGFLGLDYMAAMTSLRQCSDTTDLEKLCTFISCQ
ncbi:serotransferrin-like [Corythoichthys intestinalis]|uniref:serotransferrin-like n=1 Tax=Corythoichthys intestinalis TaxID=161448 RepID=UPI0025A65ABC|nr:serotransferrin-like [Corythoichthys intestinalis]